MLALVAPSWLTGGKLSWPRHAAPCPPWSPRAPGAQADAAVRRGLWRALLQRAPGVCAQLWRGGGALATGVRAQVGLSLAKRWGCSLWPRAVVVAADQALQSCALARTVMLGRLSDQLRGGPRQAGTVLAGVASRC